MKISNIHSVFFSLLLFAKYKQGKNTVPAAEAKTENRKKTRERNYLGMFFFIILFFNVVTVNKKNYVNGRSQNWGTL